MGHPIRLDITQNVICHPSESVVYNAADGTFPLQKAVYKYKTAIYSVMNLHYFTMIYPTVIIKYYICSCICDMLHQFCLMIDFIRKVDSGGTASHLKPVCPSPAISGEELEKANILNNDRCQVKKQKPSNDKLTGFIAHSLQKECRHMVQLCPSGNLTNPEEEPLFQVAKYGFGRNNDYNSSLRFYPKQKYSILGQQSWNLAKTCVLLVVLQGIKQRQWPISLQTINFLHH